MTPLEPPQLKLPDCEADCPWTEFVAITKPFIPVDYAAECKLDEDDEDGDSTRQRIEETDSDEQNWGLKTLIN